MRDRDCAYYGQITASLDRLVACSTNQVGQSAEHAEILGSDWLKPELNSVDLAVASTYLGHFKKSTLIDRLIDFAAYNGN